MSTLKRVRNNIKQKPESRANGTRILGKSGSDCAYCSGADPNLTGIARTRRGIEKAYRPTGPTGSRVTDDVAVVGVANA